MTDCWSKYHIHVVIASRGLGVGFSLANEDCLFQDIWEDSYPELPHSQTLAIKHARIGRK